MYGSHVAAAPLLGAHLDLTFALLEATFSSPHLTFHPNNQSGSFSGWVSRLWDDACSRSATRFFLVLMLVALGLRLPHLSGKGLWLDEISSLTFAEMRWTDFWALVKQHEGNMIAYYLLLRAWIHLGDNRVVAKLLSVLFGVFTVPGIYLLGKELYDRRVGLISACLLTVSACHVRASQWIRSYSLLLLMLVLASLFLVRSLREPVFRNWSPFVLCAALAVYSHLYATLVIGTQLVWVIFARGREISWKRFLFAVLALALLLVPAVVYVLFQNTGQLDWVPAPRLWELMHWAVFLAGAGSTGVAYALLLICIGVAGISFSKSRTIWLVSGRSVESWRTALPFLWLVLPVIFAFLFSYRKPIFFFRYLIICFPPFLLIVAHGISCWRPSKVRTGVLTLALCLSLTSVVLAYKTEEDWDGSIRYLLSQVHDGEAVFPGAGGVPLEYFMRHWFAPGQAPRLERPQYATAEAAVSDFASTHPRVWVVVFPNFAPEPQTLKLWASLRPYYPIVEEKKFKAVSIQRLERLPKTTN
jgi:mannosyltransferase